MKILTRLAGFVLLMLWGITFGVILGLLYIPLYIISPTVSDKFIDWCGNFANRPAAMLTDGSETMI